MKVILKETQYNILVENIKKEKYRSLIFSLLKTLLGKLTIEYTKDPNPIYHLIRDQYGENVMDIYIGKYANKGCKKDLTLPYEISKKIESYIPEHRHKTFSKVLVDYVYEQTGEKCDCVQYEYNFKWVPYENDDDDDDDDFSDDLQGHDESKLRKYNVKKKKKIKESVDGKSSNESINKNKKFLIDYLGEDFINRIEQVTSQYDVPYELKRKLDYPTLRRMMNFWGPMYLVNINGKKYLYQDRDDYEWFMDNEGGSYVDGEILEELGIGVMGLRFSDILDMFF